MTTHDLVTTAEAVRISGRSRYVLYRLVKNKQLAYAIKQPTATGGYLFERSVIEALAKQKAAA